MMNNREAQNQFDRIAAARLSKIKGGVKKHVALSNSRSITLRNKLNRMGLQGEHIEAAKNMIDEIGLQGVLQHQSLGVRFATMPSSKSKPKIWKYQ
jgi:hypothetical protein